MKILLLSVVLLLSFNVLADHHEENMDFNSAKASMLTHIDEKIADLQEHKKCVSNAKAREDVKKCHESMKNKRKSNKDKFKEMRKDWNQKKKSHKDKKKK